jgi:uncharacterized protein (DUF2236 family)
MGVGADADPGLFGPTSVTWRLHADPVLPLAGVRALLLQALHPLAMAGVAQHSGFRGDPWGRLFRTGAYVATITYGTSAAAERAGARLRGIHRRLSGVEPVSGTTYRVDDPELLLWVHCCEVDSFLSTTRRCGARISAADADRYLAEQVRAAALVGLPSDQVPASVAALTEYFEAVRPQLRMTPAARQAALFVLAPPMPRWVSLATPARPLWLGTAGLAVAMLPRWARRLYRLPGVPTTGPVATLQGRALRTALIRLPAHLREGPQLRAARARLSGPGQSVLRLAAAPA